MEKNDISEIAFNALKKIGEQFPRVAPVLTAAITCAVLGVACTNDIAGPRVDADRIDVAEMEGLIGSAIRGCAVQATQDYAPEFAAGNAADPELARTIADAVANCAAMEFSRIKDLRAIVSFDAIINEAGVETRVDGMSVDTHAAQHNGTRVFHHDEKSKVTGSSIIERYNIQVGVGDDLER